MALTRAKMRRVFEDNPNIKEAMDAAIKASEEHAARMRKRPEQDKGVVKEIGRKLYELYKGEKAYLHKKPKQSLKKRESKK